jgi:hypothetical protein
MTISEGASFVHGGGNNIRGKRGLRETMTADAITLVYPPDYARYLIGKPFMKGLMGIVCRCYRVLVKVNPA